jgi:hypothetical protein
MLLLTYLAQVLPGPITDPVAVFLTILAITAFLSLVRCSNKTKLASVSAKVLFSMYLTSMEKAVC